MNGAGFMYGLDHLLDPAAGIPDWLAGRPAGLLSHPAATAADGAHAAHLLHAHPEIHLKKLFGPEHGFFGRGAAGEEMGDGLHPELGLPIYSLYGAHRKPTAAMLEGLEILLIDLQDLGVRCYTYVSTLRYVLEACAEQQIAVAVLDRPLPLPGVIDGPLPDPGFESFVACVPMPLLYGMTPAEAARFLIHSQGLELEFHRVLTCGGEDRLTDPQRHWIPPSPAIRSSETACMYPITVWAEALPQFDIDRQGEQPFQVLQAPFLQAGRVKDGLEQRGGWPGIELVVQARDTLFLELTDREKIWPASFAVQLLAALRDTHGEKTLWEPPGVRPAFFDQLMGTDRVRKSLQAGPPAEDIITEWKNDPRRKDFLSRRAASLLYA